MTDIDTDFLRQCWPNPGEHTTSVRPTHCDVCCLRIPCDWMDVLDDLHGCLDRLDELQ